MAFEARVISSLEKVFMDGCRDSAAELTFISAFQGERISFQILCHNVDAANAAVSVSVFCDDLKFRVFEVGFVPVTFPVNNRVDDNYLRTTPGLYPDPLYPHHGLLTIPKGQYRSIWITTKIPENISGDRKITIALEDAWDKKKTWKTLDLNAHIIPTRLPKAKLMHTEWFHVDCLATWYHVPVFSEAHWHIIGQYMKNAADFGANMILTPILTPPLDTQVGGERPTVQLVDVTVVSENLHNVTLEKTVSTNSFSECELKSPSYRFDFSNLIRYIELAKTCGFEYFEMSHLFTQWGAAHAPKVVAHTKDGDKRIFGWETDAGSPEYTAFLQALLKELLPVLKELGVLQHTYFHISDEPNAEQLPSYKRARDSVKDVLKDCHMIDALSDYAFYEQGIVKTPVPGIDRIEPFVEHQVPELWGYYCCVQGKDVSNLFMAMPSERNRILGYQLYKYRVAGFLHWGYNFWYSEASIEQINPYTETGAKDTLPAGDAYMVYPGTDGKPISSLRQYVQNEAFQDMAALQLLENLGIEAQAVIKEKLQGISFKDYPHSASWILKTREEVNRLIEEHMEKQVGKYAGQLDQAGEKSRIDWEQYGAEVIEL